MALTLMTLTLMGNLALWFAAVYGHFWLARGQGNETYHFLTGLFAAFLSVFAHCMSMFFFIGTGKMIREAVQEHNLDSAYNTKAKGFKLRYFPIASFTIAATMATPIVGGAAHAGRLDPKAHLALACGALLLNALATGVAWRFMWMNQGLIREVESRLPPPGQTHPG